MGRVRILDVSTPSSVVKAFRPLGRSKLTNVMGRMTPRLKIAMRVHLIRVVEQTLASTSLKKKSGRLEKFVRSGARVSGTRFTNLRASVTAPEWVAAHEFGTTILPKTASRLAIPLPDALRGDGTPRFKGPSSWKRFGSFIYTNKKGKMFIVMKKGGDWVWLYTLVKESKVPRRLGLLKTWNEMLGELVGIWGSIMVQEMAATNILDIPAGEKSAKRSLRAIGAVGLLRRGFKVSRLLTKRKR